jgi:protocatechuate 3,4-dioxygenase beta subunit
MKRRKFIEHTSLLALSVGVFGKIKWDGEKYTGTNPTTTDILGPFYRPGAPFKTDLVQPGSKGELLHFGGTVFDKDGKTPVSGALVEIWHCDETGTYDNTSDKYIYRASAKTKADGKYHFRTILPVPYSVAATITRPAHIHMRISATGVQDLVTQIYFKGDKHIPKDSSAGDPKSLNRILDISVNDKNEKNVRFDVFLREEYVLENTAFQKIAGLYEMSNQSMMEFYRDGDQLFVKINGQIMEALDYTGNNSFLGGLAQTKVQFELLANGSVKAKVNYQDDNQKWMEVTGTKTLKYPS